MAPPSALVIATQSVQRLVKEETYYHKELVGQKVRVQKLEDGLKNGSADADQNAEYVLRQEKMAAAETEKMFGPLRERISDAVRKLEEQIALGESEGAGDEELAKAREALKAGQLVAGTEEV